MDDLWWVRTALTGVASGFVAALPVGPINVTIVNEGAKKGFLWAWLIGAGAALMDVIYCALALTGFAGFLSGKKATVAMELISFALLAYLGIRYIMARDIPEKHSKTAEAVERRLHPHTAFWIGFVRVLGNPVVLFFWVTLTANFLAEEWIHDSQAGRGVFLFGNLLGAVGWFTLLSFGVSRGHGRISARSLLKISRVSGVILLLTAVYMGMRLFRTLR